MKALTQLLVITGFLLITSTLNAEAKPCKSQADEVETAIEFCEGKLQCSAKTPPEEIKCTGRSGRWICRCVKPKPAGGGSANMGNGNAGGEETTTEETVVEETEGEEPPTDQ